MVLPNLIHPVPIILQQLEKTNTFYDDDYREPIQQPTYSDNIELVGQISMFSKDEYILTPGGSQEQSSGYVLFRYHDLSSKSIIIKQHDRFMNIGVFETDVYVIRAKPMASYTDRGGATLVKVYFTDRQPKRARLDQ